jgi:hypothetical protein
VAAITSIKLYAFKTGTPLGNFNVSVYGKADGNTNPTGANLIASTSVLASSITTGVNTFSLSFSTTEGYSYFVVVSCPAGTISNRVDAVGGDGWLSDDSGSSWAGPGPGQLYAQFFEGAVQRLGTKLLAGGNSGVYGNRWIASQAYYTVGKAINVSPVDSSINVDVSGGLNLDWSAGKLATKFDVYLNDDLLVSDTTATLYAHSGVGLSIFDNTWKINSKDVQDNIADGDTWSFCISTSFVITPAINPTPANTATGVSRTVEFTWEGGNVIGWPVPVSYKIYIDDELAGTSETKSFSPPALGYNQTVSWRVDTYAGASWAASSTWTFTTATLGGYPLPTGENAISQKRRLIAAAADRIWIEDI